MNPINVAKEALRILWKHKILWWFGLFVAGGSTSRTPPGVGLHHKGGGTWPAWVLPLLIVGAIVGLACIVAHFVSEGALIAAARDAREGKPLRAKAEIKAGWSFVGRIILLKLLVFAAIGTSALAIAAPAVPGALHWIPIWVAVVAVLGLLGVGVPWILTLYVGYVYALRIAVLDNRRVWEAVREARRYLHGRLLDSLKLLVVTLLGQMVAVALVVMVAVVPATVVGLVAHAVGATIAGLAPLEAAIAAGALAGILLAAPVVGASGAFGSIVWTLGFLDSRAEQTA